MAWIVIAKTCIDCGGDIAFEIFDNPPTDDECKRIEDSLGGMYCIKHWVKEIEDGINEIQNETF